MEKIAVSQLLKYEDRDTGWMDAYNYFVPKFIEEAKSGKSFQDWDKNILHEFLYKRADQAISSLKQGYFTNVELKSIEDNWDKIGKKLKEIALSQNEINLIVYNELQNEINRITKQKRISSVRRLIASLQPNLLCTIVANENFNSAVILFKQYLIDFNPPANSSYFELSNYIQKYFIKEYNKDSGLEVATLVWQVYEALNSLKSKTLKNTYEESTKPNEPLNLLLSKRQIILHGPPGTGKTREALRIAGALLKEEFNLDEPDSIQHSNLSIVQFHPSYNYEDFVRGITVKTIEGKSQYITENKIFGSLCEIANAFEPEDQNDVSNYVLIIDEINRANLASVFGELILGLEYRELPIASPYSIDGDNTITIPKNLYIIGTMNTADRSIGHIDYAIKRRFAFVEMLPKDLKTELKEKFDSELFSKISALFIKEDNGSLKNAETLAPDFRYQDVWIGHSYFITKENQPIEMRLEYEIKPILREYVKDGILIDNRDNKSVQEIIENL